MSCFLPPREVRPAQRQLVHPILSAEEFRDNLRLRYNLKPQGMPDLCDGCGAKMTAEHALQCKVGGLVHCRHNDVTGEFGSLCKQAFTPGDVEYEPFIYSSTQRTAEEVTAAAKAENTTQQHNATRQQRKSAET